MLKTNANHAVEENQDGSRYCYTCESDVPADDAHDPQALPRPTRNRLTVHPAEQAHGDPSGVADPGDYNDGARRLARALLGLLPEELLVPSTGRMATVPADRPGGAR